MRPSLFLVGKEVGFYYIVTGNYIDNNQVAPITKNVDEINKMTHEEIKKKYREIISEGALTDAGGAGLGLIDIVIKSNNKLEYEFKPTGDNISFYILKVKVTIA